MVVARMYAVVIHTWFSTPPRSPTMVGMAVETIVWSRLLSSIPAISALKMIQMRRLVSSSGAGAMAVMGSVRSRVVRGGMRVVPCGGVGGCASGEELADGVDAAAGDGGGGGRAFRP